MRVKEVAGAGPVAGLAGGPAKLLASVTRAAMRRRSAVMSTRRWTPPAVRLVARPPVTASATEASLRVTRRARRPAAGPSAARLTSAPNTLQRALARRMASSSAAASAASRSWRVRRYGVASNAFSSWAADEPVR